MYRQGIKLLAIIGCLFVSAGVYAGGHKSSETTSLIQNGRSTKGIANPERGFRFEIKIGHEEKDVKLSYRDNWPFPKYKNQGVVISQAYCYLKNYWDREIAQSKLDALQADFDRARKEGVKFVLRFAYDDEYQQKNSPTLERILSHIEQLTPIVRKNIDVIYVLQIGWIGMWGEFHNDGQGLDKDPKAVAAVVDATLKMLPENRSTMMRCMRYRDTAEKEFGTDLHDLTRVGFFNDGTLASYTDGGTFPTTADDGDVEFDKVTRESEVFPVEGELFWSYACDPCRSNAIDALARSIKHHYTTFSLVHGNSELDMKEPNTIDAWKATPLTAEMMKAYKLPCDENYFASNKSVNAYEYIRDHFGYRLEVTHSEGTFENRQFHGKAVIRNVGFAHPINPRPVYLVLYNKKGVVYEYKTNIDARSFYPWKEVEVSLDGLLPADAPKGKFKAALWLPDMSETIKYRPEYAITIAEGTGYEIVGGRVLNTLK